MEGYDTETAAQSSENASRADAVAGAQKESDSAVKEKAFLLPPMADANLEMNKKTLVLDMDDTLIHATTCPDQRFDFSVEFQTEESISKCYVLKRPGLENLLQELSDLYEIVIFTAGGSIYANLVLDELDPQGRIKHRLTRENCTELPGIPAVFVKDLSKLGRDLKKIVFVDDRPFQCFQSENAYPITAFTDDVSDTELFDLVDFCKRVAASTSDVREEIRQVTSAMSASKTGFLSDMDTTGKKTLILRMEGVLVYSTWNRPPRFDFTVDGARNRQTRYVVKRPGLDRFVAELAEMYDVVVFSSDEEDYANGILDKLDPSQKMFLPTRRLFQGNYNSNLGRESCQVILVDVAPDGFSIVSPNLYPVVEFKNDMSDKTLFELADFCKRVAHSTSDLRAEILFHFHPPLAHTSAGWVECVSRTSGTHYYYNVMTKHTTRQRPTLLMTKEEYEAMWGEWTSKDGHKYYYNKITGESQWHMPPLCADSASTSTGDCLALKNHADVDENMMTSSPTLEDGKQDGCDVVLDLSELNVMFDDHLNLGEEDRKGEDEVGLNKGNAKVLNAGNDDH